MKTIRSKCVLEHGREGGYEGKERETRKVLWCERKRFRDRDSGLNVGETDELVIYVIFVMVSSLTAQHGCISSEVVM